MDRHEPGPQSAAHICHIIHEHPQQQQQQQQPQRQRRQQTLSLTVSTRCLLADFDCWQLQSNALPLVEYTSIGLLLLTRSRPRNVNNIVFLSQNQAGTGHNEATVWQKYDDVYSLKQQTMDRQVCPGGISNTRFNLDIFFLTFKCRDARCHDAAVCVLQTLGFLCRDVHHIALNSTL